MSFSIGGEECDIYTDLPNISADYEEENKRLKEKIKVLENRLKIVEKEKHHLSEKYLQTQKNISSLFKTAVTEVNRKKRTIDDLRTQLENSVFRRNKRQRTESPIREKVKPEVRIQKVEQKKINKFSDHVNKSSGEEFEAESDRLKSVTGDSNNITRSASVPLSHKNESAVPTTAPPKSSGPKRLLQQQTPPNTLYTRRLLDRIKASQRDQHHTNENKLSPLNSSCVEDNEARNTKPAVNISRNFEVKSEPSVEIKSISKHEYSSDAIHKIAQSQNSTFNNDDTDCMVIDVKQELSSTTKVVYPESALGRSSVKPEPHDTTESDVVIIGTSSSVVSDFRRRRRAKVISVSAGNKILFGSPHKSDMDSTANNILNSIKCEETSWQSNDDKSAIKRDILPLLKVVKKEEKFSPSTEQSGVCSGVNIVHQSSGGDISGEDVRCQRNTNVQERNSAVEVLREQCADMRINKAEEVNLLGSVPPEKMYIDESSGLELKASLPIQEQSNFVSESPDLHYVKSTNSEIALPNTELQHTAEPKCITLVRRRRKPISLGDSSFVVGDSRKS